MNKKGDELLFLSRIKANGEGVMKPTEASKYEEPYTLHVLSLTHKTYIAFGVNSVYVVKLKK
ncbi:hypothetical protein [Pontibacter sp. SGAir0037]|uniref:hypothetical protein n=1 Tax=Pontibacter sp. SGAir0037 TaxID=2571030 RepID=UPI0010CCE6D6|nr:hypothetical protein [Pontibacter sp. SGAir0037]QCR23100.1 hypothetical protein C1N53_12580 [Pontibacter sp. SGAir0037]